MPYHRRMRASALRFACLAATASTAAIWAAAILPTAALANGYEDYPARIAWSPDSTLLAVALPYAVAPEAPESDEGAVFIYGRDSEDGQFVWSSYGPAGVGFSPDGQALAILDNGYIALARLPLTPDAYAEPLALAPQPALDFAWAPPRYAGSGPSLLVSAGERFYGAQVYRLDPWLGTAELFASAGAESSLCLPQCDGEGKRVWLLRQDSYTGSEAYERLGWVPLGAEARMSFVRASSRQPGEYHESNHSVRGNLVYFQRGGWGQWSILALEIDRGYENLIVEGGAQPSLDSAGRYLTYLLPNPDSLARAEYAWDADRDVWVLDQETGQEARLATPRGATSLSISPDGRTVAWLDYDADGKWGLRRSANPLAGAQ